MLRLFIEGISLLSVKYYIKYKLTKSNGLNFKRVFIKQEILSEYNFSLPGSEGLELCTYICDVNLGNFESNTSNELFPKQKYRFLFCFVFSFHIKTTKNHKIEFY